MAECKDCKWWDNLEPEDKTNKSGECHRKAPLAVQPNNEEERDSYANAAWPYTDFEDFCGEFDAKE